MPDVRHYAIIVAGGSGSRMQSEVPKQFMLVHGKPILMYTIEAFFRADKQTEIIVVLPADSHQRWIKLVEEHQFTIPHQLTVGGAQRFHSVKNGLSLVTGPAIVAVHDAVRPCISTNIINTAFAQAGLSGNAVVAIKSRDSVRQKTGNGSISLNREDIYLIQTPQVFRSDILFKAYEQEYEAGFTDDASVVERAGTAIHLIEGDTHNLKITFPEDVLIAELYFDHKK